MDFNCFCKFNYAPFYHDDVTMTSPNIKERARKGSSGWIVICFLCRCGDKMIKETFYSDHYFKPMNFLQTTHIPHEILEVS